tara:strand:- start:603 stop:839 length:237 start_codon:yes stop_codon:yes gene_type:complete
MILYLAMGLATFFIFQFASSRVRSYTENYGLLKGAAWLSLIFWPLTLAVVGILLTGYGLFIAIQYSDKRIDKVMRKKK